MYLQRRRVPSINESLHSDQMHTKKSCAVPALLACGAFEAGGRVAREHVMLFRKQEKLQGNKHFLSFQE